jgi:hypothetical protein
MPKLKPFNFTAIENGDKDLAKKVILDLLQLYPRGAQRNLRKEDYKRLSGEAILSVAATKHEIGHYIQYNQEKLAEFWGYTSEQIYYVLKALGCTGTYLGESDFSYMLGSHLSYRGAKRTRSSRRLAFRLSEAWKMATRNGNLGDMLFNFRINSKDIEGVGSYSQSDYRIRVDTCIVARSENEASVFAETLYGYTGNLGDPCGWETGSGPMAMAVNMKALESLRKRKKEMEIEIERYKVSIQAVDTLSEAIEMYTMTSFGEDMA